MVEKKTTKRTTTKATAKKTTAKKTAAKTKKTSTAKSVTKPRTTTTTSRATISRSPKKVESSHDGFKWVVLILLVANLIANVIIMQNNVAKEVIVDAINEVEALKVGGEENYTILKEIYTSENFAEQQKKSLEGTRDRINGTAGSQPTMWGTTETNDNTPKKISAAQISEVLKDTYPQGDANGKLVLLEYSDYLCPFCQRQFTQGVVDEIVANFDGQISSIFKPNTRWNPTSLEIANATECAGEQGKFNEYVAEMFAAGPSQNNIESVGTTVGLNMETFNNCVEINKYDQKITDSMAQWQSLFGVRWTPGNVILNKETGEYILIAGAYPYSEFEKKIKELLNEE